MQLLLFLTTLLTDVLSSQVKISQLDAPEIQSQEYLNVTAVVSSPSPPHTALIQCWCIPSHPFNTYPTVGKSVFLGTVNNATMVVLPPHSEEGWHKPPFPMFFVLLSGKAHVQAPQTSRQPVDTLAQQYVSEDQEVWIEVGSSNQIVLALDTLGKGHLTFYPGNTETVALQIPLADEEAPDHVLLHEGPCQ